MYIQSYQKAVGESCWENEEAGEVFQFPPDATLPSLQKPLITGCEYRKERVEIQYTIKGKQITTKGNTKYNKGKYKLDNSKLGSTQ